MGSYCVASPCLRTSPASSAAAEKHVRVCAVREVREAAPPLSFLPPFPPVSIVLFDLAGVSVFVGSLSVLVSNSAYMQRRNSPHAPPPPAPCCPAALAQDTSRSRALVIALHTAPLSAQAPPQKHEEDEGPRKRRRSAEDEGPLKKRRLSFLLSLLIFNDISPHSLLCCLPGLDLGSSCLLEGIVPPAVRLDHVRHSFRVPSRFADLWLSGCAERGIDHGVWGGR